MPRLRRERPYHLWAAALPEAIRAANCSRSSAVRVTVSNLDLALKVRLAGEGAVAGARVVALLPPPVADRDNAAPVYREAFAVLRPRDPATTQKLTVWLGRPDRLDPRDRDVTDFLRVREPGLALLRKAAGMPECRFERDYLQGEYPQMEETNAVLAAGRLLALDARVRAGRGEPGPALADVAALYGMARHMDEPTLLAVLTSSALDTMAAGAFGDVVARARPAAADLAVVRPGEVSYQRALRRAAEMGDAASGLPWMSTVLVATPAAGAWDVAREGGYEAAARYWFVGTSAYRVFFLADDLAALREEKRVVLALLARPYWEAKGDWEVHKGTTVGSGGVVVSSLRSSWGRYARDATHADARHQLTRVALAAESYRATTGKLPDRVDALVPEYLPAVPTDPFSGAPLRARRDGKTLVLYSVGPDGRIDGGGGAAPRPDGLVVRLTDR